MAIANRAHTRLRLGDPEAAVVDFTWVIELMPNLPGPYAGRAQAWERLGDEQASIADRQKSRSLQARTRQSRD